MKKFFAILLAVCLLVSTFTISTFAALLENFDATLVKGGNGAVLRVSALKTDGTTYVIGDYDDFETGWNMAMKYAGSEDAMKASRYDRIVVDLLANWTANKGNFTDDAWDEANGDGFKWDTIFIPEDARVTLNLNSYTIDRGLTQVINNGEVICISDDADVIINNGTITGGASLYSAGGIYIKDDAKVTLNNVHVDGNNTSWDGGAVAVSDGSVLNVNGGSFSNNSLVIDDTWGTPHGGAVYVEDATAIFNGVEFKDNNAPNDVTEGAAIYADCSNVTINECTFDGNGVAKDDITAADAIIYGIKSTINVTKSNFKGNGGEVEDGSFDYSAIFVLDETKLVVETSEFSENLSYFIFNDEDESEIQISNTMFLSNKSAIMRCDSETSLDSYFESCIFENNGKYEDVSFYEVETFLTFYNCSMGDSAFESTRLIKFVNHATPSNVVLSASALKTNGETEFIADYDNFEIGWNTIMALADDKGLMETKSYDRIVVDFRANWYAKDGQFTEEYNNGVGFDWDAIYIQPGVRMTLNLNGFTIDRGLEGREENGEVICIDCDANVIINDGTITGGWSGNGAGGIHIHDDAKVTLNNVNFIGNFASSDDGAAIAAYDDATLIVNGGLFKDNCLYTPVGGAGYFGTVYVEDSIAVFNNVVFEHNGSDYGENYGVAIYGQDSQITVTGCTFDGNGVVDEAYEFEMASSTISLYDTIATIKDSTFVNNGSDDLIALSFSTLIMDNCTVTNNNCSCLIREGYSGEIQISNSTFTNNASNVYRAGFWSSEENFFKNCVFNNNYYGESSPTDFGLGNPVTFEDCDLGDSTFYNSEYAVFVNTDAPKGFSGGGIGSIFGEGSLSILISLCSLVASVASIGISVSLFKKKETATK